MKSFGHNSLSKNSEAARLPACAFILRESQYISFADFTALILLQGPISSLCAVGQNNQEYILKYWAICPFAHSLARSLAHSLCTLPSLWDSELLDGYLFCVFSILDHSVLFACLLLFRGEVKSSETTAVLFIFSLNHAISLFICKV